MKTYLNEKLLVLLISTILSLKEITSNKIRSFITSFGIFLGIASLLAMLSFIRAFDEDMKKKLNRLGGVDILEIDELRPETKEDEIAFSRAPGLKLSLIKKIQEKYPGITDVIPEERSWRGDIRSEGKRTKGRTIAVSQNYLKVHGLDISIGRGFTSSDFKKKKHVCIIGKRIKNDLFKNQDDVIGKILRFGKTSFEIIGVLEAEERSRESFSIFYPYFVYEKYFGGYDKPLDEIKVKIRDYTKIYKYKNIVDNELLHYQRGVRNFEIDVNSEKIADMEKSNRIMNIILIVIAVISLVVGSVNIMNVMFATITDRIREIGIRKALGATKTDIFFQFLVESVFLSLTGALLGVILGSVPSMLPSKTLPFDPFLNISDYLIAVFITVGAGIMSGLFPALKAANMKPVEALLYA